jgi:FKBP12-rapamycin complex-associated protein
MGTTTEPHIRGLLDVMFSAGLSTVLVETLEKISMRYVVGFEQSLSPFQ